MNPFERMSQYNTKRQFHIITMLSLVCLILLVLFSCMLYINVILDRNRAYVEQIMQQCLSNVEQRSFEATQFVQTLAYDSTIAQYLQEDDPLPRYEYNGQVSAFLSNMQTVQPQISDVFLFRRDDAPETFLSLLPNQQLLREKVDGSVPVILGFYPHSATISSESMALYVGCGIYNTDSPAVVKPRIGDIIVTMNLDHLDAELRKLTQLSGLQYAIVSDDLTPVCGALPEGDVILNEMIDAACMEKRALTVKTLWHELSIAPILDTQGSLIIYTNRTAVLQDMLTATALVLIVTVMMFMLLSYVFRLTRRSVSQPIENLTRELDRKPTKPLPIEGNMDIKRLALTLNQLFDSERQLTDTLLAANKQIYESQLAQNKLELQFLRSQINPHFIYNTLEVIRSISVVHRNDEIAEMVKSLAAILRYSIKGEESVALRDELHIIRCYLSIQTIRFGHRFDYAIDVSPDAESLLIPRMCLQPLVENAFTHGLENKLSDGMLRIVSRIEEDELVISVSDNGFGLSPEKTEELNRLIHQSELDQPSNTSGVGLINVARRIQIARGNEFGMYISSALQVGTTVTLKLPIRKED